MENNQLSDQEKEKQFTSQVSETLKKYNFGVPQQQLLILNDIVARNKQTPILQDLSSFIEHEYSAFIVRDENQVFSTKEQVYNHLVKEGFEPLTQPFNDKYRALCVQSKLM